MRVLVTGATGHVGPSVVERLLESGHRVRAIGRRASADLPGAEYHRCDVTDFPGLCAVMRGMDAAIHLAALAAPRLGSPETVYRVNCQGTFNVHQAAAISGVRRVVSASSIHALGYGFGVKEWPIRYLPVDEKHPTWTTDAYSFSKVQTEQIAAYFWRREGISGACLRIPGVLPPVRYDEEHVGAFVRRCRKEIEELLALDLPARRKRLGGWMEQLRRAREERVHENLRPGREPLFMDSELMGSRSDFWSAVDARDAAQAFCRALTVSYEGSHALFVTDSHNRTGVPSRTLAEIFFPEAQLGAELRGTDTLLSIDAARSLLGYEPEYSAARFF